LASKARLIPFISGLVKTRVELDNLIDMFIDNRKNTGKHLRVAEKEVTVIFLLTKPNKRNMIQLVSLHFTSM